MALVRSNELGEVSGTSHGTGSFVTSSFTPPSSSLLVVCCYAKEDAGNDTDVGTTLTISGGGHTYTKQLTGNDPTYWTGGFALWTAPVTTGASMTLTLDCGSYNIWEYYVSVVAYTGYDTVTPVDASVVDMEHSVNNGATTVTLSAAPQSDSEVIACCCMEAQNSNSGADPDSAWTELYDLGPSGSYGGMQVQVRTGSTSSTVAWDDVCTVGSSNYATHLTALEIQAAAGAPAGGITAGTLGLLGVGI